MRKTRQLKGALLEADGKGVVSDGSIWHVVEVTPTIEPPSMFVLRLSHHEEGVRRMLARSDRATVGKRIRLVDVATHRSMRMLVLDR